MMWLSGAFACTFDVLVLYLYLMFYYKLIKSMKEMQLFFKDQKDEREFLGIEDIKTFSSNSGPIGSIIESPRH